MKKLKKQRGFTLVEMLIVVAIIAILVAVSIPLFSTSLERARKATDAANERAAKALAVASLLEQKLNGDGAALTAATYNYDAATGELVADGTVPAGYGQCSTNSHADAYITVTFSQSGGTSAPIDGYTIDWAGGTNPGDNHNGVVK